MTPKQKKVSLNAAILRTITGNIGQLSHCLSNLREANPPKELSPEKLEQWMHIRDTIQAMRVDLQNLEPTFRQFADFHPEPKWKRKFDKENNNAT